MKFDNKEVAFAVNFAEKVVQETGQLSPMAIGICGDGKRYVVGMGWENDKQKVMAVAQVLKLFRERGVSEIVFMTEAWSLNIPAEEAKFPFPKPSESPKRIEIVAITYLSKQERIGVTLPMVRDGEKVSLGKTNIIMNNDFRDNLFGRYFDEATEPRKEGVDQERNRLPDGIANDLS